MGVCVFLQRNTIVVGQYEPNDEEADWPSDEEREDELAVSDLNINTMAAICVYVSCVACI